MHTNGNGCPTCEEKLKQCHPDLVSFYWWVKGNHPDLHIAWAFRDQVSQHLDFEKGKSKLDWPNSKHNHMENDQPCSLALDFFRLGDDGKAHFERELYEQIWQETQNENLPIRWGGMFRHLVDLDHFELLSVS